MRKQQLFSVLTTVWLLVIGLLARGQTPVGVTSVCKGSSINYTVSPYNSAYQYQWSSSSLGNVTSVTTTGDGATVAWGAAGTGTVTVTATDGNNVVQASGTLTVTVNALPTPFITTTTRLACQPLADSNDNKRNPQFNDTGACMKVCANSSVVYTANGSAGSTYTWSASGAVSVTPSGNTCTVYWGTPGQGSVTVTETSAAGCVGSKTMCIDIQQTPTAKFYAMPDSTVNKINICLNGSVVFVDRSTASSGSPIVTWLWDFGDGVQIASGPGSSGNPVTHKYTHAGTFNVRLTVTNACGCSSTAGEFTVIVNPKTGVTILCPRVVCAGETAHYTVDFPCKPTSWKAIGGTIVTATANAADVKWNGTSSGFGYIVYDNTACGTPCGGITTVKVPVITSTAVVDGQAVICPNKQYVYRLPEWPTTQFYWNITPNVTGGPSLAPTDQRNETAVNSGNVPGTYTLTCSYTNTMLGCGGTASFTITVQPPVSVNGPKLVCLNTTANYTITGTGAANWTLTKPNGATVPYSGTSVNPLFDQVGTYQLYAYGAFCSPDPITIKVNPLPTVPNALTGPAVACAGIPTMYTASNDQPGTVFQWSVSSGSVNGPTGSNTYATFAGAAPYTISVIRVTADDAHCVSAPLTKTILAPVTAIHISGPDTVCPSSFQNYTVDYTAGDIYDWTIIANTMGSISSGNNTPNATALWNNASGPAKLVVSMRKCLNTYTDTLDVYIRSVPSLTLTTDQSPSDTYCSGDLVTFTVNPAIGSYGSVLWDFGDGSTMGTGLPTQTHTYLTTGSTTTANFNATVTVTNPYGCVMTASANRQVWVKPAPVAHVSPDGPIYHCGTGFTDVLTATITTGVGGSYTYSWNSGGTTAIENETNYGSYYVVVTNSNGCAATSNTVNIVESCASPCGPGTPPTISLTPSITACGHVHISATTTGGFSPTWIVPPGAHGVVNTSTSSDADYDVAGNYVYTYIVSYLNNAGDVCNVTAQTNQIVPYIAGLMHSVTCLGGSYQLTLLDHSTIYPGTSVLRKYYLDGTLITSPLGTTALSVTVNVPPGPHTMTMELYDGVTPVCTATDNVYLDSLPQAKFEIINTPQPACLGFVPVQFHNLSTPGSLSSYWLFGDGTANTQPDPYRVYGQISPPTKTVVLTVTNIYGCTSTTTNPVSTVPSSLGLNAGLQGSPTAPCLGSSVLLQYQPPTGATSSPSSYTWYLGNTALYTNTFSTSYVYNPGGYWVLGTDVYGCQVESVLKVVDFVQPPPAVISGNQDQCWNSSFVLNAYAGNIPGITYQWYLNGLPISGATQATLTQTAASVTTYNYFVVVSVPRPGGGTCSNTSATFTVTVHALPPTPAVSFSIANCAPYKVVLSASTGVTGTYNWNNGLSGATAATFAGGPYQVTFTDQYGCLSRNSMDVPKDPSVYMWIFPTGCFCKLQGKEPYITGPLPVFNKWFYSLNGSPTLNGVNTVVSNYSVTAAGFYNLTLYNGYCSVTSDTMFYNDGPCRTGPYRTAGAEETQVLTNTGAEMNLVPNPAQTQVRVDYLFTGEGQENRIEVYDMMGKVLVSHPVTDVSGSWTMPVTDFASGIYLVIMRRDGDVLQMRKLSVTH
ncbi:PKD domain-containing protein [Taibaiella soli]|uniref:PKD domain-containing protein n=1 Tax=Taibaiella soli TaxID=1649169 RepID=A0A2W2BKQ5_9BACT|nr:PKD domain-containing protein [Taibaiella soli]PZF74056.1 hypothetical protein DN068_05015 [Taibaiella soli]